MEKRVLMIPGPIEVASNVLKAMSSPMEAHYGEKWANYYNSTLDMLRDIIKTKSETFIIVGSGHSAIEAAVSSIVEQNEEVLILSNGFFGERIAEIVESYQGKAIQFNANWGKPIDSNALEEFLKRSGSRFKKVMMVHHETSTGVRNPIQELARVSKKYGLITVVDAVSSIGVTEFDMDEWGIDICITASQKGLGAPPGLAIISVSDDGWEAMENRKTKISGWYLNLLTMKKYAEKQRGYHPYGNTMAVNNVKALRASLENIEQEGLENRIKRHDEMAYYFRRELQKLGLEIVPEERFSANNLTVVYPPSEMNSEELIRIFDEDYQIVIANGLGKFSGKIVRIGHMNLGANKICLDSVLNAFKIITKEKKTKNKEKMTK